MKSITLKTLIAAGAIAMSSMAMANEEVVVEVMTATTSCDSVTYTAAVTEKFPEIKNACQEIVENNGKLFTRVDAKLRDSGLSGKFRAQIKLQDGSFGPTHHVKKSAAFGAWSEGKQVSFSDLRPNQIVSFYVPHDRFDLVWDITVTEMVMELPETAGSLHWMALVGAGLLGFGGLTRRLRKRA